ncbi:hypothetical protein SGFS_091040 [Streptomyces graminofaciens]|uniref:Uncharacterized protein n=1 Tax=Streptomyces graminofaciens TaxID=68212 RepID=A0ABM7FMG3_9ACTN|nr:hypothetical protein SGFS_091040 [Streptomyces graminofaciens]
MDASVDWEQADSSRAEAEARESAARGKRVRRDERDIAAPGGAMVQKRKGEAGRVNPEQGTEMSHRGAAGNAR